MFNIDEAFDQLLKEDILYEKVLYMVVESRWRKLLAMGKLSTGKGSALRRIQKDKGAPDPLYVKQLLKQGKQKQADAYLKKRGLIKSARSWLAAVERGTQNILKRYKAKVLHKPDTSFTKMVAASGAEQATGLKVGKTMRNPLGAHAKISPGGGRRRVHVATGVKKKDQGLATIFKRHEAGEIQSGVKQSKSKLSKGTVIPMKPEYGHISDEVLRKERELTRTAKALYGKKAGGKTVSKMRKQTGEYSQLGKKGKREIAKGEKELRKDMIQQIRDQRKEVKGMSPEEKKQWIAMVKRQLKGMFSPKDVKKVLRQYVN